MYFLKWTCTVKGLILIHNFTRKVLLENSSSKAEFRIVSTKMLTNVINGLWSTLHASCFRFAVSVSPL